MSQKGLQQTKHNLRPMRIPYAGSKILLFLFISGGKWHVLGLPTVIIIQNNQFNNNKNNNNSVIHVDSLISPIGTDACINHAAHSSAEAGIGEKVVCSHVVHCLNEAGIGVDPRRGLSAPIDAQYNILAGGLTAPLDARCNLDPEITATNDRSEIEASNTDDHAVGELSKPIGSCGIETSALQHIGRPHVYLDNSQETLSNYQQLKRSYHDNAYYVRVPKNEATMRRRNGDKH